MNYTIYDYLGLFFFYAFLGWLLETSVAAIRKKHMVNRGFLNGPLCAIYGITAVFMTRYLYELQSSPVFLFLGCMIIATAVEWLAGHALERIGHGKWWDYSNKNGTWTAISASSILYSGNFRTACHENRQSPLLYSSSFNSGRFPAYHILDSLWYIGSRCRRFLCCSAPHHEKMPRISAMNDQIDAFTRRLSVRVYRYLERRVERAYPAVQPVPEKKRKQKPAYLPKDAAFTKSFFSSSSAHFWAILQKPYSAASPPVSG